MPCTSCGSENVTKFGGEVGVAGDIDELPVFVFPELVICLACGVAQFVVPEAELRRLARDPPVAGFWQD